MYNSEGSTPNLVASEFFTSAICAASGVPPPSVLMEKSMLKMYDCGAAPTVSRLALGVPGAQAVQLASTVSPVTTVTCTLPAVDVLELALGVPAPFPAGADD